MPEPFFMSLQSIIFDEVDLTDASVAESSTKNVNNSFTVGLLLSWFVARLACLSDLNKCVHSFLTN